MGKKKSDLSRRKFISATAVGLAGAGLTGFSPGLAVAEDEKKEKSKDVILRPLGKNGPELPIVSMGVASTNDPGLVQASFELGIRHFDTAGGYQFGRNEQMIGMVLNKMGVRDKANIASKATIVQDSTGMSAEETKKKLIKMVEASLRRMKSDYIDVFYLHDLTAADQVAHPGVIEALQILRDQKKIIQAGTSTHANMAEVINETLKHDIFEVILTSLNFTMADDKTLLDAIESAGKKGVGIVAMKTQAAGGRWPNPESRQKYDNKVINSAALKWAMRNKNVSTSIPGFANYEHMNDNFAIAHDLEYTEQEAEFLKDNQALLSIGFCRQCRKCLASCPNGADIPNMMRTHMYAAQYGELTRARKAYDSIKKGARLDACADCSECLAECANAVDIDRRIYELKSMYA
jgi:predicted aldo/keto reductase-like oxidoreductase